MVVHHRPDGANAEPVSDGRPEVDEKDGKPLGLLRNLLGRSRADEEQHQIGVLGSGDPDFLAAHDVAVLLTPGERLQLRRIRPCAGLGDAERLEANLAFRDPRQEVPLLFLGAVPQERSHDVHLGVTDGGVSRGSVDLFQDQARVENPETDAPVRLGNQSGEPASFGERRNELRGVAELSVELLPVGRREALADFPYRLADLFLLDSETKVHGRD